MGKVVTANIRNVSIPTIIVGQKLWTGDYGCKLVIKGLDLPTGTQAHFSLTEKYGEPIPMIGIKENDFFSVDIPDNLLKEKNKNCDYQIYVFVYSTDANSGWTVHEIIIPVKTRPDTDSYQEPDPEQQGTFDLVVEQVKSYAETAEVNSKSAHENAVSSSESAEIAEKCAISTQEYASYVEEASKNIAYDREQIQKNTEDIEYLKEHGGSSYELPQATVNTLGGVKAELKTDSDTVPVKIEEDGKLYVPSYPIVKEPDQTLTKEGVPADAKAVGDKLNFFGGTVEITSGEPKKERTVLIVDPDTEEIHLYTAEEVDELLGNIKTGAEAWRTICDYELTEDIRQNNITADIDGNPFKLKKAMIFVKAIGADTNEQNSQMRMFANNNAIGQIDSACVIGATRYVKYYVEIKGQRIEGYKSTAVTSLGQYPGLGALNINPDLIFEEGCITKVHFDTNHTTSFYAAGTRITVIGVDA